MYCTICTALAPPSPLIGVKLQQQKIQYNIYVNKVTALQLSIYLLPDYATGGFYCLAVPPAMAGLLKKMIYALRTYNFTLRNFFFSSAPLYTVFQCRFNFIDKQYFVTILFSNHGPLNPLVGLVGWNQFLVQSDRKIKQVGQLKEQRKYALAFKCTSKNYIYIFFLIAYFDS